MNGLPVLLVRANARCCLQTALGMAVFFSLASPGNGQRQPSSAIPDTQPAPKFDLTSAVKTETKSHPWQDDAALHDVKFIGRKVGWAVGDHGTVWATEDGGESWRRIPVPVGSSLRSISFWQKEGASSNQIAWIAGRDTEPYTRVGFGTLLKTVDGGKTWKQMGFRLPPLNYVRFFGGERGIAVGEATNRFPTGVFLTEDGGETWQPAAGKKSVGWHTAAFTEFHDGVIAGPRGRISLVAGSNVAEPRFDSQSLRSIRALTMVDGFSGWAVGEGALALRTTNGAVTWEPPETSLPRQLARFMDFRAVASIGSKVWVAGSPGSVVWHSPDQGKTWQAQKTAHRQPIHALHFSSETHGWSVGALGIIQRTIDGGRTWNIVRGGDRRTAVLTIHARPDQVPFGMLSKYGGEEGFRSVVTVMPRLENGSGFSSSFELERQLQDAVTQVGGSAAKLGWRLPIVLPELDADKDALTREWQKHTENQLVEVVVSDLVSQIRMWRPSVVVVDEVAANDAATELIQGAVRRAVRDAGDSNTWVEHRQFASLDTWKTKAVFKRTRNAKTAQVSIRPYSVLSKQAATIESFSERGRSRLLPTVDYRAAAEFYSTLVTGEQRFQLVSQRDIFSGISIPPTSPARRPALPYDAAVSEEYSRLATKQKHFRGIVDRFIDDPVKAAQILAEVRDVVSELPRQEAAMQLTQLASDYRQRGNWELAEATLIELINLYPDQPISGDAMLWLLQFWGSQEMAWHRSRDVDLEAGRTTTNRAELQKKLSRLVEESGRASDDPVKLASELSVDPLENLQRVAMRESQDPGQWRNAANLYWRQQSLQMARLIQRRFPRAFQTPEVEWPLASALRRTGMPAMADTIYRRRAASALRLLDGPGEQPLSRKDDSNLAARLAAAELWVARPADSMPAFLSSATFATLKPRLDGRFSDECWQDAKEIRLAGKTGAPAGDGLVVGSYPFVLLSYDSDFFYIAASLPRPAAGKGIPPQYDGRKHDMDLTGHDRLSLCLDIDRDYTTAYEIHIDERGHVSESLWGHDWWNPKMSVAIDSSPTRWRLEAAIRLKDLLEIAPQKKDVWAVSIIRTIPKVGWQSWVTPVGGETKAERFGLIRFR